MKSINQKTMKFGYILAASLGVLSTIPAQAHENRTACTGPDPQTATDCYIFAVGFRPEPAWNNEMNAFDFFPAVITDRSDASNKNEALDVRGNHDVVDLNVEVLFLKTDAPDAKVLKRAALKDRLHEDFEAPGRYNIYFKPTKTGAYGFHITGTLQAIKSPGPNGHAADHDPVTLDETFICGGGAHTSDPLILPKDIHRFNCVQTKQLFPTDDDH